MSVDAGQLAGYLTPAVILVGGFRWLVGIIWKRYETTRKEDRDHASKRANEIKEDLAVYQEESTKILSRIEAQTTKTNGRVDELEKQTYAIEQILKDRQNR